MESIIRDSPVNHMMDHNLFCHQQHGFLPGCSCMTQLFVTLELWSGLLDSGGTIDVIYLDFEKAFDTVSHQKLMRKLKVYGVSGKLLEWIQDVLTGRRQRLHGSKWEAVTTGIYSERNSPRKSPTARSYLVCHFHK